MIALVLTIASFAAGNAPPTSTTTTTIVPPRGRKHRRERRKQRDDSHGGTRKGGIEFALGSITAAVATVLIGRGIWELQLGQRLDQACLEGTTNDPRCDRTNPSLGHEVSGGLSLGLAVPMAIASGFLFAYGVEIHRDAKAFEAAHLSFRPWATPRSSGLRMQWRF